MGEAGAPSPLLRRRLSWVPADAGGILTPVFGRRAKRERHVDLIADDPDVQCADEASARAEATRRQAGETEDGVEWIYLHRDRDGQWVVRRYTGESDSPEPESRTSRALGEAVGGLVDPTNWIN
jgi:hypothetical protein